MSINSEYSKHTSQVRATRPRLGLDKDKLTFCIFDALEHLPTPVTISFAILHCCDALKRLSCKKRVRVRFRFRFRVRVRVRVRVHTSEGRSYTTMQDTKKKAKHDNTRHDKAQQGNTKRGQDRRRKA
jgi:hypothetical protein